MMKKILYTFILILAASLATAQETDNQQQKKPADNPVTEQKKSEPAKPAASSKTPTPDTFVPSEEISEDLSVSFPVDI